MPVIEILPQTGREGGLFWLIDSIRLIDGNWKQIIEDCFTINSISEGAYNYHDLVNMPFRIYDYLVERSREEIKIFEAKHAG